jgi:hypothetical protein
MKALENVTVINIGRHYHLWAEGECSGKKEFGGMSLISAEMETIGEDMNVACWIAEFSEIPLARVIQQPMDGLMSRKLPCQC